MEYYEFVGKLTLLDRLVVGKRKEIPYDLVVGIPCGDGKSFFPIYHISSEYLHHIKDFSTIYNYIFALINKDKKTLSEINHYAEGLKIKSAARGVRVGQDLFGGEIEEDIEDMTGKKVLGIFENVMIANPHSNLSQEIEAKIDTGAYSSSISSDLAIELGYTKIVQRFNDPDINNSKPTRKSFHDPLLASIVSVYSAHGKTIRPKVVIKLTLGGITFETLATIAEREDLKYKVLIGRRDSRKFIVDPSKIKSNSTYMNNRL